MLAEPLSSPEPFPAPRRLPNFQHLLLDLALILVLLAGGYFRFSGVAWDEFTYMHPDERFAIWVTSDLQPLTDLGDYFNTETSTLNPHNRGHGFFVYGTFPVFLTRYLVNVFYEIAGWEQIAIVGRTLSALFDLLTVALVYLTAARQYNRRVAWLAAAFLAAAALPIQLAHFYKEDTFLNFFTLLAIYFAIRIAKPGHAVDEEGHFTLHALSRQWLVYLGFGLALGLGVASKLNAAPVAFMLPLAVGIRLWREWQTWSRPQRNVAVFWAFGLMALAAFTSLLVFRVAQPYAFAGPGFFNVSLNQAWVDDIAEQRNQAAGDVDFPPALQWARRPVWFALENIVVWGFGLPLGLLALVGFVWVGWRMLRGEAPEHLILWVWTAAYLVWQSSQFNPTMRYLLPIYPMLAIFAAWALVKLWDSRRDERFGALKAGASVLTGVVVLSLTFAYAYAFAQIYTRPFTRAEASRWIYENIPGPLNLPIQTGAGEVRQLLFFPYEYVLEPGQPAYIAPFVPKESGSLTGIQIGRILDLQSDPGQAAVQFVLSGPGEGGPALSTAALTASVPQPQGEQAFPVEPVAASFNPPPVLAAGETYVLAMQLSSGQPPVNLYGVVDLIAQINGTETILTLNLADALLRPNQPFNLTFQMPGEGLLTNLTLRLEPGPAVVSSDKTLQVMLARDPEGNQPLASADLTAPLDDPDGPAGEGYWLAFDQPAAVAQNETYFLRISLAGEGGAYTLRGAGIANDGTWDDPLPLRVEGYDGYGGIYPLELNFEMYWDDNDAKRERFKRVLDDADYIVITSNRQWGVLPRLPERFPLVTTYYHELMGCPAELSVETCYRQAQVGTYAGRLGFELVYVADSSPTLAGFTVNTQYAEEAHTVYDHPKVFIFRKTAAYSSALAAASLDAVDLTRVIRVTPKRATAQPLDLMLPNDRLAEQQNGGTWSELFDTESWLNRFPALGVVVWYLLIALLGLAVYPLVRSALPGLRDHGYPLARLVGLLLLAYLAWLYGSAGLPVTRLALAGIVLGLALLGGWLWWRSRSDLVGELRRERAFYLLVEALALVSFLLFLAIRIGNPDLWHPWKGGEKPMDFSYLNAVLRSTTFPPYDPWFAGGYINYYYYGFVIVGMPVKLLGIEPAIAYNLILPLIFSFLVLGAFSLGWNLVNGKPVRSAAQALPDGSPGAAPALPLSSEAGDGSALGLEPYVTALPRRSLRDDFRELFAELSTWIGLAAALALAVIGNLGIVRMFVRGYQTLAATMPLDEANLLQRTLWTFEGAIKALTGQNLPYGIADWYWNPSRAIPALNDVEPITEFPFFTLIYADLHAHLVALPVTLLVLAWALSMLKSRARWGSLLAAAAGFGLGALAIGALYPTNTWDFPTYLLIGALATGYAVWRNPPNFGGQLRAELGETLWRWLCAASGALLLAGLSLLLYQPYFQWYGQGYNAVDPWSGSLTPIWAYWQHWGVFLFVIVTWLIYESLDWMAKTPLSALKRLAPYQSVIGTALLALLAVILTLGLKLPDGNTLPVGRGVQVVWLALPLAAWAGVLLLRPGQPDAKRGVLFLIGSGFVLSLVVEIIVLRGDIGRMNTVFKFYYQVWTMFALSSAAALGWLIPNLHKFPWRLRSLWQFALAMLVASAALYPLLASLAKVEDRMTAGSAPGLHGLNFMTNSKYFDEGGEYDLSQDYNAIRWLQENVQGSPVIVEGNTVEYRWGSRMTIYTGLPGVVGWNWHQRQQRGTITPADWVTNRIAEIFIFYTTTDTAVTEQFLRKYNVQYVIVGQLEAGYYPGDGLLKFPALEGVLWNKVFEDRQTAIYQVISPDTSAEVSQP